MLDIDLEGECTFDHLDADPVGKLEGPAGKLSSRCCFVTCTTATIPAGLAGLDFEGGVCEEAEPEDAPLRGIMPTGKGAGSTFF